MTSRLEEQIKSFAARNLEHDRRQTAPADSSLPPYPTALTPGPGRRPLLVSGAIALVLLVVIGLVLISTGTGRDTDVGVTDPPTPVAPELVVATRAAAATTKWFTGAWPEHARFVISSVAELGDKVASGACDPATPVFLVEFTWDEPFTIHRPDGSTDPAGPVTDTVDYFQVGDPLGGDPAGCESAYGSYGISPEPIDLTGLGTPNPIDVSDRLLVVASAHAMDRTGLLHRLPTAVEAFTTTPDQFDVLELAGGAGQQCEGAQIVVFQMSYDPVETYLGEGPEGPVSPAITTALDFSDLPLDAPRSDTCSGGMMTAEPIDLTPLGPPERLDITH